MKTTLRTCCKNFCLLKVYDFRRKNESQNYKMKSRRPSQLFFHHVVEFLEDPHLSALQKTRVMSD